MKIQGGYTFYGQEIGILMLDTVFPRVKGDIGNAYTFPFPVRYYVVKNVFTGKKLPRDADEILLSAFCKAAKELESEGCKAITTSCGFLAGFQEELADAVSIPVFTSTLALVPMIYPMIGKGKKIAIFTERAEFMTEYLFQKSGWSSENIPVCVYDLPKNSDFNQLVIYDRPDGEIDGIRDCIEGMVKRCMAENDDIGAIVLECQNFAPYGNLIQKISGVPVFGINQLVEFIHSAVCYPEY